MFYCLEEAWSCFELVQFPSVARVTKGLSWFCTSHHKLVSTQQFAQKDCYSESNQESAHNIQDTNKLGFLGHEHLPGYIGE